MTMSSPGHTTLNLVCKFWKGCIYKTRIHKLIHLIYRSVTRAAHHPYLRSVVMHKSSTSSANLCLEKPMSVLRWWVLLKCCDPNWGAQLIGRRRAVLTRLTSLAVGRRRAVLTRLTSLADTIDFPIMWFWLLLLVTSVNNNTAICIAHVFCPQVFQMSSSIHGIRFELPAVAATASALVCQERSARSPQLDSDKRVELPLRFLLVK